MLSLTRNSISRLLMPVSQGFVKKANLSAISATQVSGDPSSKVMLAEEPAHIKAIVDQIAQLKFHEVTILSEALKRELKIPDLQRVAAAPVAAGEADGEASTTSAKTSFTVKLTKFDDTKKVALIKEIKKLVEGINLVEAKRFVEECPRVIRSNLTKEEAEVLQKQLEAAGATVKLE